MKRQLLLVTTMVILAVIVGSGYLALQGSPSGPGNVIPGSVSLVRPAIAQTASFLNTEAGMSAYTDTGLTINLNNARNAFRTVERETTDWIIGSVEVPGYPEEEDAHVFVHRTGWIVAYYDQGSPVARVIHWNAPVSPGLTKLEQAVGVVANAAGVPAPGVGFFDFRFPNAAEWLLVIDNDTFEVTIPKEFAVFERSFSHFVTGHSGTQIRIDGNILSNEQSGTFYGQITPTILSSDVPHKVELSSSSNTSSSVAISLLYIP
jgi:hypothetical protein